MLAMEVSTMVAIEVPSVRCMICASGKPWAEKIMNRNGTSVSPPPTPNSPAMKPAKTPSSG